MIDSDAKATVRFKLLDVLMACGDVGMESKVDVLVEAIKDPSTICAFKEYLQEQDKRVC